VGVVMIDGWPIAHHVFEGNRKDDSTVEGVVEDLEERFGLRRVVLVGDLGMVSSDNLDRLRARGHGYLVGLQRRRRPEIVRYLERASGPWQECPVGIAAREKSQGPKTRVQEVASGQARVRVFVVHSEEREEYERRQRERSMEQVRKELVGLQQRVEKGQLKAPEKIGAAAARLLARNHGVRYYDWKLQGGKFHYFEHPTHLPRERALEGKYLIRTEELPWVCDPPKDMKIGAGWRCMLTGTWNGRGRFGSG
jgi:transposase